ncbi:Protein of unknown function [Bacillus mycoides]|nr:Protein of unknown function [Bacillus mycoides]
MKSIGEIVGSLTSDKLEEGTKEKVENRI